MHLQHRAPTPYFEPFLLRMPRLASDAVGPTRVLGTAVLQQDIDPAQTVGIKPLLVSGTGVADGAGDMIQVVDRIKAELHGQKPFAFGTGRFRAEQPGHQKRLSDRIPVFYVSGHARESKIPNYQTSNYSNINGDSVSNQTHL